MPDLGYVADLDYPSGFILDQTPSLLNLACAINSVEPLPAGDGLSYCELGCGPGVTLCLLAAASPRTEFHGIDLMPSHIASARRLAAKVGLSNVHFHEADVADLAGPGSGLPSFDMVAMHGLYAWVPESVQSAIGRFLLHHLRSGGICLVGHNVQPGWEQAITIQKLLREFAQLVQEPSTGQVRRAVAMLERMASLAQPAQPKDGVLAELSGYGKAGQFSYLAHEYLQPHWRPRPFTAVARDLAAAKLSFVGSVQPLDNFPELNLTPEQRAILADVGVAEIAETIKDVILNQRFRRDVFVRGPIRVSAARRDAILADITVAAVVPPSKISLELRTPQGIARANPTAYEPMYAALATGPQRLGDLQEAARQAGGAPGLPEIAGILVGSRQAQPAPAALNLEATPAMRRYNRLIAERSTRGEQRTIQGLAAAKLDGGLRVDGAELIAYHILAAEQERPIGAEDLADAVVEIMQGWGEQADTKINPQALRRHVVFIHAELLPLWRRLGAI